jgi:hypothetical protein
MKKDSRVKKAVEVNVRRSFDRIAAVIERRCRVKGDATTWRSIDQSCVVE